MADKVRSLRDPVEGESISSNHEVYFSGPEKEALPDVCKAVNHFRSQQRGEIAMTDYVDIS